VTLVAGFAPDGRGRAVLHLAAMLARSGDEDLVVCAVVPESWPPGPARVDAEYQAYLQATADGALRHALERLPDDVRATTVVHHARSAAVGLLDVAEQHDAAILVVGSASAGGMGQVALGSTTSRLLHSSHVPVAVASRGFRVRPDTRVTRVTAAFGGSAEADELVVAAAGVAARVGASLRIASFAVLTPPPHTSGVGHEAEHGLVDEWEEEIKAAARAVLDQVCALPAVPRGVEAVVGYGETWDEALEDIEWRDGDVLVVGSSAGGPLERVFLGSNASKIVRHAPVPVVVVPRGRAAELAGQAAAARAT
jgi:nucleotide-binding universal stress UspA family protein